jgi:quinol monooxygenase YgiN
MVDVTNSIDGWDNFGWVRSGDRLGWRSSFDDVDSMLASVSSVTPLLDRMLRTAATMDRLELVGPKEHMARIRKESEKIAAAVSNKDEKYFENVEDLQVGYFRKPAALLEGVQVKPNNICTMTPHYTIKDWPTTQPMMQAILNKSNSEPGCTYFGWAKAGDKLHSKESFVDGTALEAHVKAVRPLIDAMVNSDAVTLERMEITGPSAEVDKVKLLVEDLKPEFLAIEEDSFPQERIEAAA